MADRSAPASVRALVGGLVLLGLGVCVRAAYVLVNGQPSSDDRVPMLISVAVMLGLLGLIGWSILRGHRAVWSILTFVLGIGLLVANAVAGATILQSGEALPAVVIVATLVYVGVVYRSTSAWLNATRALGAVVAVVLAAEVAMNISTVSAVALLSSAAASAVVTMMACALYAPATLEWFGKRKSQATADVLVVLMAIAAATPLPVLAQDRGGQRGPASAVAPALKVTTVKRGERYSKFGSELSPTDSRGDVVLMLDVGGLSVEQFQNTQRTAKDTIFIMAGARKCVPGIMTSGSSQPIDATGKPTGPVKEERLLVVVVPRNVLDFTLHFGESQVALRAPQAIAQTLP